MMREERLDKRWWVRENRDGRVLFICEIEVSEPIRASLQQRTYRAMVLDVVMSYSHFYCPQNERSWEAWYIIVVDRRV